MKDTGDTSTWKQGTEAMLVDNANGAFGKHLPFNGLRTQVSPFL